MAGESLENPKAMDEIFRLRRHSPRGRRSIGRHLGSAAAAILLLLHAGPAAAAPPLEDLTIPAQRVPDFYLPPDLDTSAWIVTAVHAVNCADNGTDDGAAVRAAINAAAPQTVILLDGAAGSPCTYNFNTQTLDLLKSNLVVRGGGAGNTIVKFMHTNATYPCGAGGGVSLVNICGTSAPGSPVNWTSGFTVGTATLGVANASSFPPGTWVDTFACYNPGYGVGCTGGNSATNRFIARVQSRSTSSGAGTIILDRPLIEDASNAAQQRTIRPFNPVSNVGVESLTIMPYDYTRSEYNYKYTLRFQMAVTSWAKGVNIEGYYNVAVRFEAAARCEFSHGAVNRGYYHPFNESGLTFNEGAVQNAAINNIFNKNWNWTKVQAGAAGNIFAYNFGRRLAGSDGMVACNVSSNGGIESSIYHHGLATVTLEEGNDVDCKTKEDQFWGPQADRNVWFRNRVSVGAYVDNAASASTTPGAFGITNEHTDRAKPTNFSGAWLLNTASLMRGNLSPYDFDGSTYNVLGASMWIERNLVRGSLQLVPRADTVSVNNVTGATTTQGVGDWASKRFPASLVYTSKPSWWLSAPWPAIGADVDVIGGTMHKLPAQCRYEGSTSGDCAPQTGALGIPGRPQLMP